MDPGPTAVVANMLRAVAQRDNPGFLDWRSQMNRNDPAKRFLYPVLYEVFRLLTRTSVP